MVQESVSIELKRLLKVNSALQAMQEAEGTYNALSCRGTIGIWVSATIHTITQKYILFDGSRIRLDRIEEIVQS